MAKTIVIEKEQENVNLFSDWEEVVRYANRKRDWHKNKGKRRIKEGYKGDRYI